MSPPLVVIFHQRPHPGDAPLGGLLARARDALVEHQADLFRRAGGRVLVLPGRAPSSVETFGQRLARLVDEEHLDGSGLVILGGGAVPQLRAADAARLLAAATGPRGRALTNNHFSSDICAIPDARVLRALPPLPSDNALPRWLEERAGHVVAELPGRDRLALDLDTPSDLLLLARSSATPVGLRALAAQTGLAIPHAEALRALAADPRRELLVAGRAGSGTLRWLERSTRGRVRFLAEERGLRASSALATGQQPPIGVACPARPPRSTLGRLLDAHGPDAFGAILADLCDGAIVDSRVLLADRFGADEATWPSAEDRFASDLARTDAIRDPWLRALSAAAAAAPIPVLLCAHTVIGPGLPLLLGPTATPRTARRAGPPALE